MEVSVEGGDALEADAVVLAVGGTSAAKLKATSPPLSECHGFEKLRGVTCVATRIWPEPSPHPTTGLRGGLHDTTTAPQPLARAMMDSPVAVVGPEILPILNLTGFCVYDLERMHDEQQASNTACIEIDFYRANDVADMTNEEIISLSLRAVATAFKIPVINASMVVDSAVVRARSAVSHFCVGSADASPPSVLGPRLFTCGDYVDRSGHASWSTEKAVVTGRQAAAAVSKTLNLSGVDSSVILAAPDTPQLAALRRTSRLLRKVVSPETLPIPPPWTWRG